MISGRKRITQALTPSPQQEAALDFIVSGTGNLLLRARAGTGKSSTLRMMIQYMTGSVFVGAFNKSIQLEFAEKLNEIGVDTRNVAVKTIHAAGFGAMRGFYKGKSPDTNKVRYIIDDLATKNPEYGRYEVFFNKLVGLAKLHGFGVIAPLDEDEPWHDLIDTYSVDDELRELSYDDDGSADTFERLIDMARKIYTTSMDQCKDIIDFNDMLVAPLWYGMKFPTYDWVLIDECQDLSDIRIEIACKMLKPGGRFVAVGDDRQQLYSFTGVRPNVIEDIKKRMNMTELPLTVTYRCPQVVVKRAQGYVPDLQAHETAPVGEESTVWLETSVCPACGGARYVKEVEGKQVPTTDEDGQPCSACKGSGKDNPAFWDLAHTLGPNDVILCRTNRPIVDLAYQLLRKGIACQIEGRDFASSLIKLCQRWKVKELNALETKLREYVEREAGKLRQKKQEERAASLEDKIDTLLSLLDNVRGSGGTKVTDLIDKINQLFGEVQQGQKPRVLTLSSIHKSKGKEWDTVYLLGREKYVSKWARKPWEKEVEFINIPYVACTRSRKKIVDIIVK